jgi:hypothetical protein
MFVRLLHRDGVAGSKLVLVRRGLLREILIEFICFAAFRLPWLHI